MNPTTLDDSAGRAARSGVDATPPPRRSRGRRWTGFVGIVLILAGVATLGYVAWEYWGTNIISKREHAALRDELHERWRNPSAADVLGPQAASAALGTADALIRIPAFGTDYEVPMIEGVRDEDLSRGIGHFPGTGPGQIGNFALAGHRVTHGEPFRDLPDLRPGDEVVVETGAATFVYELDTDPNDLVIPFTESWVLDDVPIPPEGEAPAGMPALTGPDPVDAIITLTTCSELFHTDDRMVAFGHLVSTSPRT